MELAHNNLVAKKCFFGNWYVNMDVDSIPQTNLNLQEGEATITYEGDVTKTLAPDQVILIKAEER